LLSLALLLREPLEEALGLSRDTGERIVYTYSSVFPHWLLNSFFLFFGVLAVLAVFAGVFRLWRGMRSATMSSGAPNPTKPMFPCIITALKNVFTHDKFDTCETARPRLWSHACVFFGFLALSLVTIWVITAEHNPLIRGTFVYPFSFWNPWKVLANVGGAALLAGCLLMIRDRLKNSELIDTGSYFDWVLIATLLLVVLTGFFTEVLHYVRLEPHRHIAYFVHLVFVFALLVYLPYSKFAHIIYRTVMLVYAEYSGRGSDLRTVPVTVKEGAEEE
jgi:quinone-modifying oxidoreductase subunit QmoC